MAKRSKNAIASGKKFDDIFGHARPTFDGMVHRLKEWCRSTLIKEGFDPEGVLPTPQSNGLSPESATLICC